jgi:hypothetical protein
MVYKEVHLKGVADLVNADIDAAAAIAKSKIATAGAWAVADIPSLPTSIITSGIFAGVRGGLEKELVGDFQNDYIIVYKTADGKFHMQSLGAPAAHNFLDAATHNNTLAGTPVRGDLIVANSTPAWARFAKGTANYFLVMGANDPAWTAFSATLHGTLATVGQHPDVVGGASGALTTTQHGALAGPASAHRWADILKMTSSIADITTKDHDLLSGLSDDDHTQYLLVAGTRAMTGALRLALLSADPSLVEGMLFYRSDTDALYISYDGSTKKQIFTEGQAAAEAVLFGNGYSDTLVPPNMTSTGNGTFTKDHFYGILTSGAGLNDKTAAYCIWSPASPAMGDAVYGKTPEFEISIYIPDVTTIKIWVLWGGSNNVAETAVNKRFGLKIVNTALYGIAADGSTLTETDLSTALAVSTWYKIRVKHTGSSITFWKDGVQLGTTVTTNLPSGSDTAESCVQVIVANTVAADRSVRFKPMKILHGT